VDLVLDSSALSRIYELSSRDRSAVLTGLRVLGHLHVTTVNVLEAAMHPDPTERAQKLRFYTDLTGAISPADPPNELLIKTARAYLAGQDTIDLGSNEAWALLHATDLLSDDIRDESFAWTAQRKQEFRATHETLRATYQEHFAQVPTDRAGSALDLIAYFCERIDHYYDTLLIPAFARATGVTPSHEQIHHFMQASTPWRLFWAARVHALYTRSVQPEGYGDRNAGQTDLESSIYLAFCNTFITYDRKQYTALQDLNTLNHRNTNLLWYGDLRDTFLLTP
jgi:hypothetical protein